MQQLIDLLPDYTAGKLTGEQRETVEALLNDYVDDALDAETTQAIEQAAASDQALAEELGQARRGKEKLAALLPPADEPLEDPSSPEIQRLLDGIFADQPEGDRSANDSAKTGIVIPFPSLHVLSSERVLQALAASLAVVVVGGAIWLSLGVQGVVEEGRLARLALEGQLDQAASER
ncbi:MAG: hypothetical protein HC871_16515, partial [Rhizobiales bacterium]|nr:hypothetical protein [Hyphomicrobiales bacterium]